MKPGTLGEWTGERWAPIDDDEFTRRVNQILASHAAAALADPDLGLIPPDLARTVRQDFTTGTGEDLYAHHLQRAAKALAGFLLDRVTETKAEA